LICVSVDNEALHEKNNPYPGYAMVCVTVICSKCKKSYKTHFKKGEDLTDCLKRIERKSGFQIAPNYFNGIDNHICQSCLRKAQNSLL